MASVTLTASGINFADYQTLTGVTGASVSSELYDHYEEGTWTPTTLNHTGWGNGAMGGVVAAYTRAGREVFINFYYTLGDATDGLAIDNRFQMQGMPFTIADANYTGNCALFFYNSTNGGLFRMYPPNGTTLQLICIVQDGSPAKNGGAIGGNFHYRV